MKKYYIFIYLLYFIFKKLNKKILNLKRNSNMGIGDWGLGIGDWGLGIGDWAQSPIPNPPIPNPQSPIPNPQSPFILWFIKINIFF